MLYILRRVAYKGRVLDFSLIDRIVYILNEGEFTRALTYFRLDIAIYRPPRNSHAGVFDSCGANMVSPVYFPTPSPCVRVRRHLCTPCIYIYIGGWVYAFSVCVYWILFRRIYIVARCRLSSKRDKNLESWATDVP